MSDLRLTKRELIEKRREQVYTLHLRGGSLHEIAETLGIPRSVAQYDIARVRAGNAKWYEKNRSVDERFRGLYKELWDRHLDAYREAWILYMSSEASDVRVRSSLLGQVQQCLERLRALYGKIMPDAEFMDSEE